MTHRLTLFALTVAMQLGPSVSPLPAQTLLASISDDELVADAASSAPALDEEGKYIAFASSATNLVANDTNGVPDIFVHHQESLVANGDGTDGIRETSRVSVSSASGQADGASSAPSISDNARFVTFVSAATNLVAGDTNGKDDIFLHDRQSGTTTRISVALNNSGVQTAEADGHSAAPQVSADGCFVVYESDATNLNALNQAGTPLSDTNAKRDVFLYYNPNGTDGCFGGTAYNELLSVGPSDAQGNGDSYAGYFGTVRYVTFTSAASNLIAGDTNGAPDIFVRDRAVELGGSAVDRLTFLLSRNSDGTIGNGASYSSAMEGNQVVFDSDASNLVAVDTNGKRDVFKAEITGRNAVTTTRISETLTGEEGDGDSFAPSIAGGGNYVAFASDATNLDSRTDCNGARDIFVRDFVLSTLRRVSLSTSGYQSPSGFASDAPSIAYGGILVGYTTSAALSPQDTNELTDIYLSVASVDPATRDNPLTRAERLDEPPDICVSGRSASVFMERYSSVEAAADGREKLQATNGECGQSKFCYTVTAVPTKNGRRDTRRDLVRKIGKRNELSLRRLPPGDYRVTFKVRGRAGGSAFNTNTSPPRAISVARSR